MDYLECLENNNGSAIETGFLRLFTTYQKFLFCLQNGLSFLFSPTCIRLFEVNFDSNLIVLSIKILSFKLIFALDALPINLKTIIGVFSVVFPTCNFMQ